MFAIRAPFASFGGAVLAALLFLGLARLVSVPFEIPAFDKGYEIIFTPQIVESEPQTKRQPKVVREPPQLTPDAPTLGVTKGGGIERVPYLRPELDAALPSVSTGVSGVDTDVIPRVRVNPEYPPRAIAASIEGWVQVRFTITAVGTVRDAAVVASEPGTTFDEAALNAIARWRYNPRVVNGEAVERVGVQTVIRFELAD